MPKIIEKCHLEKKNQNNYEIKVIIIKIIKIEVFVNFFFNLFEVLILKNREKKYLENACYYKHVF